MFLWEGFRKKGKIKIPKDVVVFEFETLIFPWLFSSIEQS